MGACRVSGEVWVKKRTENVVKIRVWQKWRRGWAHYALFLWEIKISMQGVRTWAAWAKRIFLSSEVITVEFCSLENMLHLHCWTNLLYCLCFLCWKQTTVHKLSLTPVFSSHVVPTFNHGHAVCKCDLTETHRAEQNLRGPWTKGLAGKLGLVSISNVQRCSFNSTGNTKLSHIIVIKS